MNSNLREEDLKIIARQLSCPDGEKGVMTGERMNSSNGNMIRRTIDTLAIQENENVLEIGPGNGSHVAYLLSIANNVSYTGIDISDTMVQEAKKINADYVTSGNATFSLSDGTTLAFASNHFDAVFTVNTIYFWENPLAYASEIYRVLKPGGRFCLAFAHQDFMKSLPFTQYGFQLYDPETASQLLTDAQFSIDTVLQEVEQVSSNNMGEAVERQIILMLATKPH